mgnify:CR=1 FL=1
MEALLFVAFMFITEHSEYDRTVLESSDAVLCLHQEQEELLPLAIGQTLFWYRVEHLGDFCSDQEVFCHMADS